MCARIEATTIGLDIRFVVTSLARSSAEHIYDVVYCARGQAENLIKMHKSQLASDRTSCRSPLANQVRLVLHTAAYWLMLTLRDAVPATHHLRKAEFATLRLRLLKLGARVSETARASAWPSPPPVPRPRSSAISPASCSRQRHESRGTDAPLNPLQPTSSAFQKSGHNRGETDAVILHGPTIGGTRTAQLVNRTG